MGDNFTKAGDNVTNQGDNDLACPHINEKICSFLKKEQILFLIL
jgi:hypothetical protein